MVFSSLNRKRRCPIPFIFTKLQYPRLDRRYHHT
jgi:hypothetical protein